MGWLEPSVAAAGAAGSVLATAGLAASARRRTAAGSALARLRPAAVATPRGMVSSGVGRWLVDAGITWPARSVVRAWVASVVGATAATAAVAGASVAVLVLASLSVGPVVGFRARSAALRRAAGRALPLALEQVARSLRAGASLRQAITEASRAVPPPLDRELAGVAIAAERGVPLVAAVEEWAARCPLRGAPLAAAVLGLSATIGGPSARAVDGAASTLRERLAVEREVAALSSQARASAVVIAGAPLAFGFVAAAADPRSARFLFGSGRGLACLLAGLALNGIGAWWMARIIGRHR